MDNRNIDVFNKSQKNSLLLQLKNVTPKLLKAEKLRVFKQLEKHEQIHSIFFQDFDRLTRTKLQRFQLLLLFFIILVSIILCLSKIYSRVIEIKSRRKRYGYFLNARYEAAIYKLIHKFKNKLQAIVKTIKMSIEANRTPHNTTSHIKNDCEYQVDVGHENKIFDISDEIMSVTLLNRSDTSSSHRNSCETFSLYERQSIMEESTDKKSYISRFFERRRIQSLKYNSIRNNLAARNNYSNDDLSLMYGNKKKCFFSNIENMVHSIGFSEKLAIKFNRSKRSSLKSDSIMTNMTEIVEIELPLILVTDTNKMVTKVIDLDTFQPEKNQG